MRYIYLATAFVTIFIGTAGCGTGSTTATSPATQVLERRSFEITLIILSPPVSEAQGDIGVTAGSVRTLLAVPDECPELSQANAHESNRRRERCFTVSPSEATAETSDATYIQIHLTPSNSWLSCPNCVNKSMRRVNIDLPNQSRSGPRLVDVGHQLVILAIEMNKKNRRMVEWRNIEVGQHVIKAIGDNENKITRCPFDSYCPPFTQLDQRRPPHAWRSQP